MKSMTLLFILGFLVVGTSHAFSTSFFSTIKQPTRSNTNTALYGKGRRGRLANNISLDDEGNVKLISNKQKQKLGSSKSKRVSKQSSEISPLLAEWAKEGDSEDAINIKGRSSSAESSFDSTGALSKSDIFVPFDEDDEDENEDESNSLRKKGRRKNKKKSSFSSSSGGTIMQLTPQQTEQMDNVLTQITDMISTTNCNVPDLITQITSLVDLRASFSNNNQILLPTLKSITSAKPPLTTKADDDNNKQPSYRLAWVGSDEAICHIGTSLHKVPLARLQEMYLLLGYNKWELLEVIRILGPFPNVRNTLKGDLKLKKLNTNSSSGGREGVRMEIAYQSMIDGTGKEILAGKDDNVKYVKLDVWFASNKALVCTTVPDDEEEDGGEDPLSGDGSNMLLFLVEDDLDEALEKLRAA